MEGRIVRISGEEKNFQAGNFCSPWSKGLPLEQEIIWVEERVHCGACAIICLQERWYWNVRKWCARFESDRCIICEHCITACPARAMEVCY